VLSRTVKDTLYGHTARVGRALASPQRLELLDLLAQREQTVEALAAATRLSLKNVSAHLRVLRQANLVDVRREAQFRYYRLAHDAVAAFLVSLRDLAEQRLAEVREVTREYFGARRRMAPVDRARLLRRVQHGDVTVLDLRSPGEYAAGHIPGARSVPLTELRRTLRSIPRHQEIVAYCQGPWCVLSEEAVTLLTEKGYRATRLDDGLVEWKAAGLPLVRKQAVQRRRAHPIAV
jgi:rhodanese-related sulfurtransferase